MGADSQLAAAYSALRAGKLAEAERALRRLLRDRPEHGGAAHLLGIVLHRAGRNEHALGFLDRAVRADPADTQAAGNRATVLNALGRHEPALAELQRALRLRPEDAALQYNLGNTHLALGQNDDASAAYARALARQPGFREAWQNRGLALSRAGDLEGALTCFDRVLALSAAPSNPAEASALAEIWASKAWALDWLNRRREALAACEAALALDSQHALAHWNAAPILLALGNYERGWREWEWRWRSPSFPLRVRRFEAPLWLGVESLSDRTILLHAEQGFGDVLQFCRFAKDIAARGARVLLQAPIPLLPLLRTLAGVDRLLAPEDPLPPIDFHTPLMSLPLALGLTLQTVPGAAYLAADPDRVAKWRVILGEAGRPRIAIAWSGNPGVPTDRWRSAPLAELAPLFLPGVEYVALQRELRATDHDAVGRLGIRMFGDEIGDFADTAAIATLSDLVISTDTGPAHVAGAIGQPLWLLLHDAAEWRWLMEREDSPWYPTARLFRQAKRGAWRSLAERVAGELRHRLVAP